MLEGQTFTPATLPGTIAPAPAVMAILDRFNREEIGNAIEVLVALLDLQDGDADNEPNGDDEAREADGDTDDAAYIEWHTMRGSQKAGPNIIAGHEDSEDDDPAEDDDPPEDDDPGGCEHDGREPDHDDEREQLAHDVPVFPVFTAEHNIFNDKRTFVGFSNLQSSYVGEDVLSAETGALHSRGGWSREPGRPV